MKATMTDVQKAIEQLGCGWNISFIFHRQEDLIPEIGRALGLSGRWILMGLGLHLFILVFLQNVWMVVLELANSSKISVAFCIALVTELDVNGKIP
jgi:hypothetical protein